MAVKEITHVQKWQGLELDTKPTPDFIGSTFYELDTGQKWIWDGSNWVEDIRLTKALSDALT